VPSDEELVRIGRGDPTLEASALALLLEHGAPTEAQLDRAAELLERVDEIEEGALEIGRALYARRPTERVKTLVVRRIERAYATLGRPEWRARFVAHVERSVGGLAAEWVIRARPPS
jgi:hypothetical protein